MFGGLVSLLNGKMFAGMLMCALVVRVGPETNDQALKKLTRDRWISRDGR